MNYEECKTEEEAHQRVEFHKSLKRCAYYLPMREGFWQVRFWD